MKYGKLDDVAHVDFRLPADDAGNAAVLKEARQYAMPLPRKQKGDVNAPTLFGEDSGAPSFYPKENRDRPALLMGGTMWNLPQWKGKIFPLKCRQQDFLHYYAQAFPTIELNATHYRTPSLDTVRSWCDQTPEDFIFCPKFPQSISHYRRFNDCEAITDQFMEVLLAFGKRLGPAFIQLPPNYSPEHAAKLERYLMHLPHDLSFALEFRHPDWFAEGAPLWDLLRERNIIAVLSDTAGRRDAVHMRLTSSTFILRFGGNNLHESDYSRLDQWMDRAKYWGSMGLKQFHLWMHQTDSILTPETCSYVMEKWK